MPGTDLSACTIAQAMMCVNETLPPLDVRRKLLMSVRWSMTSFIGMLRTEVAVGTDRDASMFFAVRMGAPRMTVYFGSAALGSGRRLGFGALADRPAPVPGLAGVSAVERVASTLDRDSVASGVVGFAAAGFAAGCLGASCLGASCFAAVGFGAVCCF